MAIKVQSTTVIDDGRNILNINDVAIAGNTVFSGGISANNSYGTSGQVLTSTGAGVVWATPEAGGSVTDLTFSSDATSVSIFSSTGADIVLLGANTTAAGILTADAQTIAGDKTFTSSINVTGIYANNSLGTSGQVLATNGSTTYWSTPAEGSGGNSFTTIAISGQSNVVADSSTDTLTLVAGTGVTLTTDAVTDSITISSSGGSGGGITTGKAIAMAMIFGG